MNTLTAPKAFITDDNGKAIPNPEYVAQQKDRFRAKTDAFLSVATGSGKSGARFAMDEERRSRVLEGAIRLGWVKEKPAPIRRVVNAPKKRTLEEVHSDLKNLVDLAASGAPKPTDAKNVRDLRAFHNGLIGRGIDEETLKSFRDILREKGWI